ncbi:MAG: PAS domain S-box protein [Flavobacteriia bacterium]|nr:PAS domain S-box protein [Flavobacteriia bacterium]
MINITCANQSNDGMMWFGTDGDGLLQYDGRKVTEVKLPKTDNYHHITEIFKDKKNNLFFVSKYKGIYKITNKGFQHLFKNKKFKSDSYNFVIHHSTIYNVQELFVSIKKKDEVIALKYINEPKIKIEQIIELNHGFIILSKTNHYYVNFNNQIMLLQDYIKCNKSEISNIKAGYIQDDVLFLYSKDLTRSFSITINKKDDILSKKVKKNKEFLKNSEEIIASAYNQTRRMFVVITNKNRLFSKKGLSFRQIEINNSTEILACKSIFIDNYGDIWICSAAKGVYKISRELFTKIEIAEEYKNPLINTFYKDQKGTTILSSMDGMTSFSLNGRDFKKVKIKTYATCKFNNELILGTENGLKKFDLESNQIIDIIVPSIKNKKINFILPFKESIWLGVGDLGLVQYFPKTKKCKIYKELYKDFPRFFYTAQISYDGSSIIFGSNFGLHRFDIQTETFKSLKNNYPHKLGTYCGLSSKDIYGTNWFTFESGIVGISKHNQYYIINNPKYFKSTLFYTLNSDLLGNLIIGTNKGITILEINASGNVLNQNTFSGDSGFSGFETHMRSQFQQENKIYVGTIEGLFLIDTEELPKIYKLNIPTVRVVKMSNQKDGFQNNSVSFNFFVNNPKIERIFYTYRLKGHSNEWSNYSTNNLAEFNNLYSGHYIFEVKATINGNVFSKIKSCQIKISYPFWKSNWFIIALIVVFIGINIFFLNRFKTFDPKQLFSNNDVSITRNLTPKIILYGGIINAIVNTVISKIDQRIPVFLNLTFAVSLLIFILFLTTLFLSRNKLSHKLKKILILSFLIIVTHNLLESIYSSLHPYFIIITLIFTTLSPFVFDKIKHHLIFFLFIILFCLFAVFFLEIELFNRYLFLLSIVLAVSISLFITFLRFDSLSKLFFISGVINKGDVPVISFDSEGLMIYVSENISNFMNFTSEYLINKKIKILNEKVPLYGDYRKVNLNENFIDGQKYLVPMIQEDETVIWIEWLCKVFSKDVKVIIGQNVTNRIELESTYELIVQNAEDLIFQFDIQGNFQFVNNKFISRLGYTKTELIGQSTLEIVHPKYIDEVNGFYKKHILNKFESSYYELPLCTKQGEVIWVGLHVTSVFHLGANKLIKRLLAVGRDITEKRVQQELIKEQSEGIKSSINYALNIQLSLLPKIEKIQSSFDESFIIYKPKDIVSGDFYWCEKIEEVTVFVVADCTGHGVPGAFMTLLGINMLNSIVLEKNIIEPSIILNELDHQVKTILPRNTGLNSVIDGMEITICTFNHRTFELKYGCAGSKFILSTKNEFKIIKGSNKHIGDKAENDFEGYETFQISLSSEDIIYFFSDGIQDQFGGFRDKKFSFKRLFEMLNDNKRFSLNNQKVMITDEFDRWVTNTQQTDDITLIGLKGLKKI